MKMLLIALATAGFVGAIAPAQAGSPAPGSAPAVAHNPHCDALCQEFLGALHAADDAAAEYRQELEANGGRALEPHGAMPDSDAAEQEATNSVSDGNPEVAANAAGGM
jgi:hypothetical protein